MKLHSTTILHEVREKLGLSLVDYCVAEFIYKVSRFGPMDISQTAIADHIGASPRTVGRAERHLESLGLIKMSVHNQGKVVLKESTKRWHNYTIILPDVDDTDPSQLDKVVEETITYLNEKTDQDFRASSKATRRLIQSLLRDDKELDENHFKSVVWVKTREWKDDDEMSKYLRPDTLFRKSNFYKYLDQARSAHSQLKKKKAVSDGGH